MTDPYPSDDDQYIELPIAAAARLHNGTCIIGFSGGTAIWVGAAGFVPAVDQIARIYGSLALCRGLFINGIRIVYRSAADDAATFGKRSEGSPVWLVEP